MTWLKRFGIISTCFLWVGAGMWLLADQCGDYPSFVAACPMKMEFPYALVDHPLILHGLYGYEGPYVEDKSNREVCDVAALVVENAGDTMLTNTCIAVYTRQDCFLFFAQCLPAGEKTMVLEAKEKLYLGGEPITCWAATGKDKSIAVERIALRQLDQDVLEVTGQSGKSMQRFVILHKNWSKEADAYMGGVVYETYVEELKPNQILLIRPKYYVGSISRIVGVIKDRQSSD